MTFLAPAWLGLAAGAAVAVAAIHLIAWRLPRAVILPTARFVPDEPARLAARTLRPSDLVLLALRIAIVMAAGVAMAKPTVNRSPRGAALVIALESSTAMGDSTLLRDSMRAIPRRDHTTFVVFDTGARVFAGEAAALSDVAAPRSSGTASLTVGLLAAIREARRLARDYESVDIVLASTFARASFDQATEGVRGTWDDSIRVLRILPSTPATVPAHVEVPEDDDDPIAAGIRLAEANSLLHGTSRLVRTAATTADSTWARDGRALILWPRASHNETDRVGGIHARGFTAIGHLIRLASIGDSGRVIARWLDGTPAARETTLGAGCVRTIGFDVPDVGDFVLTPSFQRLLSVLAGACGGDVLTDVASDSAIAAIAAPSRVTSFVTPPGELRAANRLAAMFMALAILLGAAELWFRRRAMSLAAQGRA